MLRRVQVRVIFSTAVRCFFVLNVYLCSLCTTPANRNVFVRRAADLNFASIMTKQSTHPNSRENERVTHFLLGLVLIFSCLFTALEYTSYSDEDAAAEEELLKHLRKESDLIPAPVPPSLPAMPKPVKQKMLTDRIKVVEKDVEHADKPTPKNTLPTAREGNAEPPEVMPERAIAETPVNADKQLSAQLLEELPEFPGGVMAFMKWLTAHLQYPPAAQAKRIEGKVVVAFIINTDGSVSDIKVEQNADAQLDREALRVMKMMPRWKPGMVKGKPCQTQISIPIVFQL